MTPLVLCLISGLVGALLGIFFLGIVSANKGRDYENKGVFYIERKSSGLCLWMKGRDGKDIIIGSDNQIQDFGLNVWEFFDMEEGETKKVVLNLID